ncbi:MAG: LPS export ABC transporter ATP-binding protein [SAR324 cluster bacterium]|nr:LPS export ABC transporter ATP-binding protein [SAR324 cluster bacterium]
MHKQVLRVKNIVKSYDGRTVVDQVSFSLTQGSIVGLLGSNGAGKTTIFYMAVGFINPDQGQILLDDSEITNLAMYQRAQLGIGYLPQENCIFRKLTVEDNILAILEVQKMKRSAKKERLDELLESLEVTHIRKSYGYALSGGERRRVEIARCLASNPKFLLLDEPFAGVDPLVVGDIQEIIQRLSTQNIGILINDHNIRETLNITHHAHIINKGKVLLSGSPEVIINSDLARQVYFGEKFKF